MLNILKALLTRALIAWLESRINRLERTVIKSKEKLDEKRLSMLNQDSDTDR